jgi:transposase
MFIRRKSTKSGSVSVQIISKQTGKYKVIKSIGCGKSESEIKELEQRAQSTINDLMFRAQLNFNINEENLYFDTLLSGLDSLYLAGPEMLLGSIFDRIGLNSIPDQLFRYLVISRICYPASKLKTVDYLYRYKGIIIDVNKIYRYLDKLNSCQKERIQQICYEHTLKSSNNSIKLVFYDVTTLYFETDKQDDFRISGFSKEGKHSNPQIILGLLISSNGDPLSYEIHEGNKYEGHTLLPILEAFSNKYKLGKLIVVADSGLLSETNITLLQERGYEYILGSRIKNEKQEIIDKILSLNLSSGQTSEIIKSNGNRIIISYSDKRARKDEINRNKGIEKLKKKIGSGKLTKSNINNKGYNKFLKMDGQVNIELDISKIESDAAWDGLKGYITNTNLSIDEILEQYGNLWKIEKAFRIVKTDLKIRPIYHRLRKRIEAHICIAFCAYKIYKELDRLLKENSIPFSCEKAIEIANTIFNIKLKSPFTNNTIEKTIIKNEEQNILAEFIKSL